MFHTNYLSPPHIAAGINLSLLAPRPAVPRRRGLLHPPRSFDDNELYKTVFRKYLTFLIREGYTQEFFIEGGRSRTGKILTPKLGMLVGRRRTRSRRAFAAISTSSRCRSTTAASSRRRRTRARCRARRRSSESLGALLRARTRPREEVRHGAT